MKVVLFDADGVLLQKRKKYFSERLIEQGHHINKEAVDRFFKEKYRKAVLGEEDLKELVLRHMHTWGWEGNAEELLSFWLHAENTINEGVLALAKDIQDTNVQVCLASDHSCYRAMQLHELFPDMNGYFISCDLQTTKDTKEFYRKVSERLDIPLKNILLVDDEEENIKAAQHAGAKGVLFSGLMDLRKELLDFY